MPRILWERPRTKYSAVLLLKGGVEAKGQGEKARFELPFLFRLS